MVTVLWVLWLAHQVHGVPEPAMMRHKPPPSRGFLLSNVLQKDIHHELESRKELEDSNERNRKRESAEYQHFLNESPGIINPLKDVPLTRDEIIKEQKDPRFVC